MTPPFTLKRKNVKPVHLATGIFVSRLGGFYPLKRLNQVVMHQLKVMRTGPHKGQVHPSDSYVSEKVFDEVRSSQVHAISDRLSREEFELVRRALHQFVANDQAAFHAFFPHRPFGNDYSTCDQRMVSIDATHPTDGGLGAFVVSALDVTPEGRSVLAAIDRILASKSSLGDLANAFIERDAQLTARPLVPVDVQDVATLMSKQTMALSHLAMRLRDNFTLETEARLLLLGLCLWILVCVLRWSERACGAATPRVLLADFSQRARRPLRRASWLSVVQARRQLADYVALCKDSNPPVGDPGNWADFFDYLGKRSGLIQPRADKSRGRKYIEPMPDTIRVLVMSSFEPNEKLLTFGTLARRLRETWSIVVGAEPSDPQRFREAGLGNLQEDDDIGENVTAFRERLEELQLAVRLSDGEHRCAALPEDLP
jgi:hypothetical protein